MSEIDYKNLSRSGLEALMNESDVKEIKTSVLRELYDAKLRE